MVKKIYFVHGTTTDNENKIATGWQGGELSDLGIKQSIDLRNKINFDEIDFVVCSDLKRAVDSAKYVFQDRKENKFAFLQFENVQLMLQEINRENYKWETGKLEYPLGVGINFQIDVNNVDDIYNRLKEVDYKIFVDIEEHWYRKDNEQLGCKEFLVQDPNGYLLRFSQDLGSKELSD